MDKPPIIYQHIKEKKMADLKGTIYVITNEVTGLKYVGQTVYSSNHRIDEHIYAAATGRTTRIATAIRNYGWDAFSVMEIWRGNKNSHPHRH